MAPVLLQLVIDWFGAVGVGGSDDGLGEPVQLCRGQDGRLVGQQLLRQYSRGTSAASAWAINR